MEKSKVPALGVELPAGFGAESLVLPLVVVVLLLPPLALALLFMMLLMNISLMSISAADALLRVGTRVSVAAVLTLAVGLLGVLMVVTLVDTPPYYSNSRAGTRAV